VLIAGTAGRVEAQPAAGRAEGSAQAPEELAPAVGPAGGSSGAMPAPPPDAPPSAATEEGLATQSPTAQAAEPVRLRGADEPHGPVVQAEFGQGFRLSSADGRQSLRIAGLFSARASVTRKDGQDPTWDAFVRLGRIVLSGNLAGNKLTYFFQGEFAGAPSLLDMELTWNPLEQLRIRFGRLRVPFGRQWIDGFGAMMLPDRSVVSDLFHPGRDTGITLESYLLDGKIELRAGAYAESADRWPRVIARAAYAPLGAFAYTEDVAARPGPTLLQIAAQGAYDKHENAGSSPSDRTTGGLEVALRAGPLALFTEAYVERRHLFYDPATTLGGTTALAAGMFAEAGVFVVPGRVEVYGRFNMYAQDIRRTGTDGLQRYEAGLSGYFFGTALKVQARYAYNNVIGAPLAVAPVDGVLPPAQGHTADIQFVLSL
jgi:hypothetical protein